ncbi:hypothetical protein ACSTAY_07420 [Vreelandella alkaliphila]|uniref:Uncharacterized protein n=1 Tax=Vreelandella alkaliphila TaxID=272774 RepID=A0AAJ2VR48_9GAMM|nr:hypothetical protein [Halomonas alkaliphila]MDX5979348.1 hypothetical protein [Halomonas alkaliphila]
MNKVEQFEGKAPKMQGEGAIHYFLWTDDKGALYVQMFENDVDTKSPGTLNQYLFPIAQYIDKRCKDSQLKVTEGLLVDNGDLGKVENNNTSAFLKAVLRHLFPCSKEA